MKTRGGTLAALILSLLPAVAGAEANYNLREELKVLERGETLPLHIPGAKYRVATFTYEDPDGTKLGDALAAIIGREMLARSQVPSIGVLTYEGRLAPNPNDPLSYFDKVERVADAQQVTLSIWGMVRRSGSTLTVDTYVQLPPRLVEKTFVWRVKLPPSMGGELIAHLRPDRILAQRLTLPADAADGILAAAQKLSELRPEPDDSATIVATLPKGSVYWMEKQEGDWIYMNAGDGRKGWVRRAGGCAGPCAPLLDAAGFAADLLACMEHPGPQAFSGQLSPDTQVIQDQLSAYNVIDSGEYRWLLATSERIEQRLREAAAAGVVPPGGAALANALAVDRIMQLVWLEARDRTQQTGRRDVMTAYSDVTPDRARVAEIAFKLADASVSDPTNADVLHNLEILFHYAGDEQRATLARSLAAQHSSP
jgi:hypothetical protein